MKSLVGVSVFSSILSFGPQPVADRLAAVSGFALNQRGLSEGLRQLGCFLQSPLAAARRAPSSAPFETSSRDTQIGSQNLWALFGACSWIQDLHLTCLRILLLI